ncbi:efflux transporter outer membrane subunit [Desulfatibacillum aliphaticivorans]|uniref:efflux transporter outer membrane subunit n=1 Tax=Desulfatibacillum aliphaticivorans TaxID=218208 RepID=UPI00041B1E72|nr:efflux transporter outer membrane subunit [Desulfatibacillum aliphaticivorans]
MKRYLIIPVVGLTLLAAGCSLKPQYTRPEAPVSQDWPEAQAAAQAVAERSQPMDLEWREFITDQALQVVIQTALENNRDLKLAILNVQRVQALYGVQKAELFPSIGASGSSSHTKTPADLSYSGQITESDSYRVDLGVTAWEADFFGRIRSLKDAALESYLATEEAQRSAQIALISAVANAYLKLAADQEHLKLSESTLQSQKDAYHLIKSRFELGLASELDLLRAQTQVETARGDIALFTRLISQDKNALILLSGTTVPLPERVFPQKLENVQPFKSVSVGIPSETLLTRPDILAAEHQLKAANANIGAARAAFFPRIALTGSVGTASVELSDLFGSGQGTWSFMPQISVPIFDPRVYSAYKVSQADMDIAVAQYEKAIQTAFRETADAIAVENTVGEQLSAGEALVEALDKSYTLAGVRYDKGIDSYLSVLDAQRSLYSAQQQLIDIRIAKLANQIRLYTVLGGGAQ